MSMKYILDGHTAVPVDDVLVWAEWFERPFDQTRLVARTEVGGVHVSTVFLALDHGWGGVPRLFETMIFLEHDSRLPARLNDYQRRYATWDESEAGHRHAVKLVTRALRLFRRATPP